jgi:hypothetical protein
LAKEIPYVPRKPLDTSSMMVESFKDVQTDKKIDMIVRKTEKVIETAEKQLRDDDIIHTHVRGKALELKQSLEIGNDI